MKLQKKILRALPVLLIVFVSGCTVIMNFTYDPKNLPVFENKINSSPAIYFSMEDVRAKPEIIGYLKNVYGARVSQLLINNDIAKAIYPKFKEEFTKTGFVFND